MRTSDLEFFRYFPIGERDREWGLYVTGVGSTRVPPFYKSYPISVHPDSYMYTWEKGRTLHEYQALYILRGNGQFESAMAGALEVLAGSVILLFPGEWHRYRPYREDGWDEYWVSFAGFYIDQLVRSDFFSPKTPVLKTGVDDVILQAFLNLLDRARTESIGHQQLNAVSVCQILAASLAAVRHQQFGSHAEDLIRRVKAMLEEQVEGNASMAKLAKSLRLSEDYLRRLFKEHTGMPPHQYCLQLKIHRARTMLRETNLTVAQIAHKLGFESPFHFSRAFKQRTGMPPSQWRQGG
jgi:AraC-like DNA-binding protein